MAEAELPLRTHPGDYLAWHDTGTIGCTLCHDGQPHAVDGAMAKSRASSYHWERPILSPPYIEARCARCHEDDLEQAPHLKLGRQLFAQNGCQGCHRVGRSGGTIGPDLSEVGDASFHLAAPTDERRQDLLERFDQNTNLAFLWESVLYPHAQPDESKMIDYGFSEQEAESLVVYLKSLSGETIADELKAPPGLREPRSGVEQGEWLFQRFCSACHDPSGQGLDVGPSGKAGPSIVSDEFLAMVSTEQIDRFIESGRESGLMPSWEGGLTKAERVRIGEFILSRKPERPDSQHLLGLEGDAELGRFVYQDHCAVCHGSGPEGSLALILESVAYVEKTEVETFLDLTLDGRLEEGMPSYVLLTERELAGLVALFRSWKTDPSLLPLATDQRIEGDTQRGAELYGRWCSMCHGAAGTGAFAPQIGSPEFKRSAGKALVQTTLAVGRGASIMLSIDKITGARDPQEAASQIADLDAFLQSLGSSKSGQ